MIIFIDYYVFEYNYDFGFVIFNPNNLEPTHFFRQRGPEINKKGFQISVTAKMDLPLCLYK